jgi:DNA-binding transcriptional regulator YiaG
MKKDIQIESSPELPPIHKRKTIREAARLSVTQLGATVGVSAVSIRQWEAGLREPRGLGRTAYPKALAELEAEATGGRE